MMGPCVLRFAGFFLANNNCSIDSSGRQTLNGAHEYSFSHDQVQRRKGSILVHCLSARCYKMQELKQQLCQLCQCSLFSIISSMKCCI
jgi:hypothetical protein